ncbi:CCAAT/enhancer-binding protein zeta [Daktulosphaira vitifoliae]|uniref:CCAAT/enhancer-binding protein zeta n=1 Tax=Daktulosphaira vitifoliae TaxID=58002 RepID=UPI0021AAAF55|nr:CCAAT/enhancer-binding protein zeta [Daktulosphaira vitifoliae]
MMSSSDSEIESDEEYNKLYSDSDADDNDLPKWYDGLPSFGTFTNLPQSEIQALRVEAEKILEHQPKIDHKKSWITEIAKQGTYSDKIAALTIKIQEDPFHNINALQNLINMVKIGKKQQCSLVIDSLTELFTRVLLKMELLIFENQPLSELSRLDDLKQRKLLLSAWLFEDKLKIMYSNFIDALSAVGLDSVPINREKSISAMYKLLISSTECEMQIVRYVVNKFGDTVHKVASKAMYTLRLVVKNRPSLSNVVFEEVRKLLFRSNIKPRAQYYGICFLTQIDTKEIAKDVIELYLSFFKACVKTGAIDSRLMGALLVGVNKTYPFIRSGIQEEQLQTMYKIVHLAPFNISLQALLLIKQLENNDRFYSALYKKIFDESLINTSHQGICIHLIYKSMWDDKCPERLIAFMKRIYQMCLYCPIPFVCGIFCMTSRLMKKHKGLIGKSKFEEVTIEAPPKPIILNEALIKEEDEDDEKYFDAQSNEVNENHQSQSSSWYHIKAPLEIKPSEESGKSQENVPKIREEKNFYDITARNPRFAGGEHAILSELIPLSRHYHPTVATFASRIIAGKSIYYDGNPLADFTVLHFLDRFSFKNPKKPRERDDKEELFRSVGSSKKHYVPKGLKSMSVVSEEYLRHEEKQIPLDEVFLYKYLKQRPKKDKKEVEQDVDGFSDVDSVNSDDFNELLDGMMGKKKKKKFDFSRGFEKKSKAKKSRETVDDDSESGEDDEFVVPTKSKNLADLAVPAEKFAAMLDEAGKKKSGGKDDIFIRDNASAKQLEWEKKKFSGKKRKRLNDGRKNRKRNRI